MVDCRILLAVVVLPIAALRAQSPRNLAFVGGHWFDGTGFRDRTLYSQAGILRSHRPSSIDSTVDLQGMFIVPPFGEAHNHNVEYYGAARAQAIVAKYLQAGVFYDQNPLTLARARNQMKPYVNNPRGVDVTFAIGGLTGTGGHPTGRYLRNLGAGVFTPADSDGGLLWVVDSLGDLDRKWNRILATHPDFIKAFLLYSEEFDKRRSDSAYFNWRGLNPALLPEVVRRAHKARLRVMCHIETAGDFHNAVVAGVDQIMHMPGFRGDEHGRLPSATPYVIPDRDASEAARKGIVVVTTLQAGSAGAAARGDTLDQQRLDSLHRANLRTLMRYHVVIAIGSDNYRETSGPEANYLQQLGVFSNADVLRMWAEATPRAIFPGRRIGRLADGYEASFLGLEGNPLTDFRNTSRIRLRVKQGVILP
jgi:hypothetical protein